MKDLLSEYTSIFVHIEPNVSQYVKAVLDNVFGSENFITEIIWKRTIAHFTAQRFAFVHDVIYQYKKGEKFKYKKPSVGHDEEYLQDKYKIDAHLDEYVFGEDGMPQKKSYLKGATVGSVWTDISPVNSQPEERLGYDPQKSEQLLERIIYSSTDEGDLVADFFCGSGTTGAVAERLGRRWLMANMILLTSLIPVFTDISRATVWTLLCFSPDFIAPLCNATEGCRAPSLTLASLHNCVYK